MPSEKDLAKAIDQIVDGDGTKANKARELFSLGCERTDVVELLDMSYSQAHQLWKQHQSGEPAKPGWQKTSSGKVSQSAVEEEARRQNNLAFSPMQVRYAKQAGLTGSPHRIIRVDTERGPECRRCGGSLYFSLEWLCFLHMSSDEDPIEIQDKYPGEEAQTAVTIGRKK